MQNPPTEPRFHSRLGRAATSALLSTLLAALLAQPALAQQPRASQGTPAKAAPARTIPTSNVPITTVGPAAPVDETPARIGTGGVVELTSLDPETQSARDTVVIPTELDPGTDIPPTKSAAAAAAPRRAAPEGRPLGKASAAVDGDAAAATAVDRSLSAGAEGGGVWMEQVVPTALALAGTISMIFVTRALMKRFGNRLGGGKRPSGVVEVLARYPFARGHHIVLIKVGRRVLVTHQSAQGIQTLSEFTSQADVADLIARCEAGSRGTDQFTFDSLLRNSDREFDAPSIRERAVVQKAQRADARSGLPASVRGAEIETIDLTRRRGVAR